MELHSAKAITNGLEQLLILTSAMVTRETPVSTNDSSLRNAALRMAKALKFSSSCGILQTSRAKGCDLWIHMDPLITNRSSGTSAILWQQVLRTKPLKIGHQVTPIPWRIAHLWVTELTALALRPLLQIQHIKLIQHIIKIIVQRWQRCSSGT